MMHLLGLNLDMHSLIEQQLFSPADGERVFLRGNFNQWQGEDYELKRNQNDDIFTATFHINSSVGDNNDLTGWIRFFLVAVEQTAEKAAMTLAEIMALREKISETLIPELGRKSKNAQTLLTFIFSNPRISVKKVEQEIGINPRAANALVQDFLNLGILKQ
jgi:Fic family protein